MPLFTLEGIDGSGKSTALNHLQKRLADLTPVFTREPGGTASGKVMRELITSHLSPRAEALLFAADHAEHIDEIISPALRSGRIVISDRYIDSRYAYQMATLDGVVSDPRVWLDDIHHGWTIVPDTTYLLTIPIPIAMTRMNRKIKDHLETVDLLMKVQDNYLTLAREFSSRFVVIDGTALGETVAEVIEADIRRRVSP